MEFNTIAELFQNTIKKHPNKELYYYKKGSNWSSINGKTISYTVKDISMSILSQNLLKGDRVGIIAKNSPKWALSDYGIICSGCATVSIYPTLIPSQIEYIINDSELQILFLENEEQLDKINQIWKSCKTLKLVVMMNDSFELESEKVVKFSTFLDFGLSLSNDDPGKFQSTVDLISENDLLTLIYTSGTTGNPKGVMLTHGNLASNIKAIMRAQKFSDNEVFLSFLPLSHVFERMCGHFSAFCIGAKTYYAESIDTVAENMKETKPTVLISVPRLYEKIYSKIITGVQSAPALRRKIFYWSLKNGRKLSLMRYNNLKPGFLLKVKYAIAKKLVFDKAKSRFGGRIKYFISGGAPLSKELAEFFYSLNLLILEGYGLTETSPIISSNTPYDYRFGTVGKPLDNVLVEIANDGEILVKGPSIMAGYYKKEEITKKAINKDGWFHTGDIGEIDSDGFLKITDRKKSLIITSGGKNVAPAPLENAILNSIYAEQCMAVGDKKNFISCLIVPNFDALNDYLGSKNIEISDKNAMVEHPAVIELFDGIVEDSMESFSNYEKVKKYKLLKNLWTLEKGEITPSLKVVRRKVSENHKDLIESIYLD
ncbi:MAG: hypothetical protein CMG13_00500 [Candidatus Marinimicrobia bacterium]|nr:hypothetical protein [Candidatus Neomarinimicrobiota bacterium]